MNPADVQATFAATLVDEWARGGVTDAVVTPGSRSTPLALALAAAEGLRLHVHHDERSAGFFALGLGLATGRPAVVLTTSGTAAVELHAAVVEAHQSRVPLLACTADRPPELHDVGAPQTVDQLHLYGRAVRWFVAPGVPREAAASTWRSLAARAVAEATGRPPGPVHLNLAFAEPLVGEAGPLPAGRPGRRPWHAMVQRPVVPDPRTPASVAEVLGAARGIIVAGDGSGDPTAVHAFAAGRGWPVLADPRSGCRLPGPTTVAAADALLRDQGFADAHRPDVVLRLGAPPASKVVAQWLAQSGAVQVAVDVHGAWWDPDRTAEVVVTADPAALCRALLDQPSPAARPEWLRAWVAAEAAAQQAIDAWLDDRDDLTEPAVARLLAATVPDGSTLVVSSSMPVRDVEWYAAPRAGVRVVANRGANGIDGVVSTAAGVAAAGPGPTTLLIGDLAFLHDANGLLGLAGRELDLTIVVVDNRGGGIFSFLPQAGALPPERFEQLFGTPHDVDLASLAAVHGLPAFRVVDPAGFQPALEAARAAAGSHVVVVPTDRAGNVVAHADLHATVAAALRA